MTFSGASLPTPIVEYYALNVLPTGRNTLGSEARSLCETIVKSGSKSWQQLWMSRLERKEAKDDLALL